MLEQAELEDLSNEQLRAFLSAFVTTLCKRVSPAAVLLAAKEAWTLHIPPPTGADAQRKGNSGAGPSQAAVEPPRMPAPAAAVGPSTEAPVAALSMLPQQLPPSAPLKLVLRHDCRSTACNDSKCKLCSCNPILPCSSVVRTAPFSYRPREPLTAPCGAPLFVEVQTLAGAPDESLGGSCAVLIVAIDAHRYDKMSRRASAYPRGALDADTFAITATPNKGHLLARDGSSGPMLGFPVSGSRASLSGLNFLVDVDSLAPAARGGLRLLATACHKVSGQPLDHVEGVLSDAFMVLSHPSVRDSSGALRSGSDPLGDLPNVTEAMLVALSDLPQLVSRLQAMYPHFNGFGSPLRSVHTIAQMRSLLTAVLASQFKTTILRETLGLSEEDWKLFLTDVCKALKPDDFVRCWSCPLQDVQLHVLFACRSGNVDFATPLGVKSSGKLTCMSQLTEENRLRVFQLLPWARAQWQVTGHPGWSMTDIDSSELLKSEAVLMAQMAQGVTPPPGPSAAAAAAAAASGAEPAAAGAASAQFQNPGPRDNEGTDALRAQLQLEGSLLPPSGAPQQAPMSAAVNAAVPGAPAQQAPVGAGAAHAAVAANPVQGTTLGKRPRPDGCTEDVPPENADSSLQAQRHDAAGASSSALTAQALSATAEGDTAKQQAAATREQHLS